MDAMEVTSEMTGDELLRVQQKLLELVKERPILWSKEPGVPRSKDAMVKARQEISEIIGIWSPGGVKREWDRLRNKYRCICKRMDLGSQRETYFAHFGAIHEFLKDTMHYRNSAGRKQAISSRVKMHQVGRKHSSGRRRRTPLDSSSDQGDDDDEFDDEDNDNEEEDDDNEDADSAGSDNQQLEVAYEVQHGADAAVQFAENEYEIGSGGETHLGRVAKAFEMAGQAPSSSKRKKQWQAADSDMASVFKAPYSAMRSVNPLSVGQRPMSHVNLSMSSTNSQSHSPSGALTISCMHGSSESEAAGPISLAASSTVASPPAGASERRQSTSGNLLTASSPLPASGSLDPFLKFVGDMLGKMSEDRQKVIKMRICELLL